MAKRVGFLYPPCGAEDELYRYGEALSDEIRICLVGVRNYGDEDEHALHHLSRTGGIANLEFSSRIMARLQPLSVVWACTSGSFVDGYEHALAQAEAISAASGCPASSTSLAFISAAKHLVVRTVAVLASYPEQASRAFESFLRAGGIQISDMVWLSMPSGSDSATLSTQRIVEEAGNMDRKGAEALLIPDTAIPAWEAIVPLERALGIPVLTANQVTLWEATRLAGVESKRGDMGQLFAR